MNLIKRVFNAVKGIFTVKVELTAGSVIETFTQGMSDVVVFQELKLDLASTAKQLAQSAVDLAQGEINEAQDEINAATEGKKKIENFFKGGDTA